MSRNPKQHVEPFVASPMSAFFVNLWNARRSRSPSQDLCSFSLSPLFRASFQSPQLPLWESSIQRPSRTPTRFLLQHPPPPKIVEQTKHKKKCAVLVKAILTLFLILALIPGFGLLNNRGKVKNNAMATASSPALPTQLKYTVSLTQPGFVQPVRQPGPQRVQDSSKGACSPPVEESDDLPHEADLHMIFRLQPIVEAYEASVSSLEHDLEVASAKFGRQRRDELDAALMGIPIDDRPKPSIYGGVGTAQELVARDIQFDYLASWYLRGDLAPENPIAIPGAADRDKEPTGAHTTATVETEGKPQGKHHKAGGARRVSTASSESALLVALDLSRRAPGAKNLKSVSLTQFAFGTLHVHALGTRMLGLSTISKLVLSSCNIFSDAIIPLCLAIRTNKFLTDLDLSYNNLDELACKALENALPSSAVTNLSVRGNPMSSDDHSTALLYLLIGTKLQRMDMGFTGMKDHSVVKLCTVMKSAECRATQLIIDGADVSPRVALLLLDTVCESRKLTLLSLQHMIHCMSAQFKARLQQALDKNKRAEILRKEGGVVQL